MRTRTGVTCVALALVAVACSGGDAADPGAPGSGAPAASEPTAGDGEQGQEAAPDGEGPRTIDRGGFELVTQGLAAATIDGVDYRFDLLECGTRPDDEALHGVGETNAANPADPDNISIEFEIQPEGHANGSAPSADPEHWVRVRVSDSESEGIDWRAGGGLDSTVFDETESGIEDWTVEGSHATGVARFGDYEGTNLDPVKALVEGTFEVQCFTA